MNNDMTGDEERFERRFWAWLLGKSDQNPSAFDRHHVEGEANGKALDPLDSEPFHAPSPDRDLEDFPAEIGEPSNLLGDIPTVQDRFKSLLQRKLQSEIQQHPPLFPWEDEMLEYELETPDCGFQLNVPVETWAAQLRNLRLPVPMPEPLLSHLLARCQDAIRLSLREGTQLVKAVEDLFPDQSNAAINDYARLVLMGPVRGEAVREITTYETATPTQQMVLSLLAAREIIGSLTLQVSSDRPVLERQWLTALGVLTLAVEYRDRALRVSVQLPEGGSVQLYRDEARAIAQRTEAGRASVELFDIQPDRTYFLDISLNGLEEHPFTFAVYPSAS